MLSNLGEWGFSEYSGCPIFIYLFFFFIFLQDLCHDQASCWAKFINIILTRNFPFDSDIRQRSHPLMIPLDCLWAKSNNRRCGQFECNVTWFHFCFDFICSYVQCGCFSIVCLRFQVVQIKQGDCKMSSKMWIIINKKDISWYFWTTAHTRV